MPTVSGWFGVLAAPALLCLIVASLASEIAAIVLVLRHVISSDAALAAAAAPALLFASLLFALRGGLLSGLVAVLIVPIAGGVLAVCVVLLASILSGAPYRAILRRAPVALVGLWAIVAAVSMWGSLRQREALETAVRSDDVAAARSLIDGGAAGDRRDTEWRQELLVHAAGVASPDVVAALLEAGADPNGLGRSRRSPLLAAIGSTPLWPPEVDPAFLAGQPHDGATHARNRYRTVEILLARGADPSGTPRDDMTPVELAWGGFPGRGVWPDVARGNGDAEILRLLKARGARDAERVPARFGEMMDAATAGDVEHLRAVLAEYRGRKPEVDAAGRSPLVAAAANGRLAAVDVLLEAYGNGVHCVFVEKAREAAARHDHAETRTRLLSVCGA